MTMKVKRIRNAVKDLGSGNRVADGAKLLQEGNAPADHAHVSRSSPISLKGQQLENDLQYQDAAINRTREASTSRKRANKETKPL
jgi:hypothetical protein